MTGPVVGRRVPLGRPAYLFLGAILISTLGATFGLLGATTAIALAGGTTDGGLLTGIYLATALLAAAVSTPSCPQLCARWGVRVTFVGAQAINAFAYAVAGGALLAGAPALPTLLIAAPVFGATTGTSLVVRPLVSQAYQASDSTAHSYARMSVALGIAWGLGGLLAGLALNAIAFGWGLVINGLLTVPLVLTVARVTPAFEPPAPPRGGLRATSAQSIGARVSNRSGISWRCTGTKSARPSCTAWRTFGPTKNAQCRKLAACSGAT